MAETRSAYIAENGLELPGVCCYAAEDGLVFIQKAWPQVGDFSVIPIQRGGKIALSR